MTRADLLSILPELILCLGGVLILLLDAFLPAVRRLFTPLALGALAGAGWTAAAGIASGGAWSGGGAALSFGGQLQAGPRELAFLGVVLVSAALALLGSEGYLRREKLFSGEYHALLLWCVTGLSLMLRATELLTLFIALELASLALYTLTAFQRRRPASTEGAFKYFVMGAFVSAFLLLGIALLYGETSSTELTGIGTSLGVGLLARPVLILGALLVLAAFGFKMSLAPFHAWAPDAYQGAPTPYVAFLSVAPKAASALVILRVLEMVEPSGLAVSWSPVVAALAVLSMAVGNLLALAQRDIKRMLAYSGVAHMGYLLLALMPIDGDSWIPMLVYLAAYALMNGGAFLAVTLLSPRTGERHAIADLAGAGYRHPFLGACLAIAMLALGGLPPTAGFFGKYLVFLHAVEGGAVWIAGVGVAASLVGIVYYLRVVYTLYMKQPETVARALQPGAPAAPPARTPGFSPPRDLWARAGLALATLGTLLLGLWPWGLLDWLIRASGGS